MHFEHFSILSTLNFSEKRWCFAMLPTAEPGHCWWIPMVCSRGKVKRQPENTAFIIFSLPRSQPSENQSPAFLLTPLLSDQIHFLAVMLPSLGYLFRFFCTCATRKWNVYRGSQQSHCDKSLLLLLAFFLHITLKKNYSFDVHSLLNCQKGAPLVENIEIEYFMYFIWANLLLSQTLALHTLDRTL